MEALARNPSDAPGGGGERMTGPEAHCDFKNRDVEYCELTVIVEEVGGALKDLPEAALSLVRLHYFERVSICEATLELKTGERSLWRKRNQALRILRDACLKVCLLVERFSDRERVREQEILDAILKGGVNCG